MLFLNSSELRKADMFDVPHQENSKIRSEDLNQSCNELFLEELLPENPLLQEPRAEAPLGKEDLNAEAEKLIDEAEKELRDRNVLPIHARDNFLKALNNKELAFGEKDERLLPLIDRLAKFSPDKEALKYKERAAEILTAKPKENHVLLAARYTDLANCYRSLKDNANADKFSQRALVLWQQKAEAKNSESLGDDYLKQGDMAKATPLYTAELAAVQRQINTFISSSGNTAKGMHSSPLEARLYQKLGDCYLASGNLEKAATSYSNARSLLERYSVEQGNGKVLPEQLSVLAGAAVVELKAETLAEERLNNPDLANNPLAILHLNQAAELLAELSRLEAITNVDKSIEDANYGKNNPQLLDSLRKVATHVSKQGEHIAAANVWQRIYDLQTAQRENEFNRIDTLNSLAKELYGGEDLDRAIKTYEQAVKLAGNNPDLHEKIGRLDFIFNLVRSGDLTNTQFYALGSGLNKAAHCQIARPDLEDSAINCLDYAVTSYNKSLKKELPVTPEILIDMASTMGIFTKLEKNENAALLKIEMPLHELADQIAKKTLAIHQADPKQNSDSIVTIIDKLTEFYLEATTGTKQAMPLLQLAFSIEKEQAKDLNVLS